jgi:hypothetical protein
VSSINICDVCSKVLVYEESVQAIRFRQRLDDGLKGSSITLSYKFRSDGLNDPHVCFKCIRDEFRKALGKLGECEEEDDDSI